MTGVSERNGTRRHDDANGVDVSAVVQELNRALRTHGGGVEHVETTPDGVVRLRMLGLCAGCLYRPLTTASTIRPLFAERTGMKVELLGARISVEAEERISRAVAGGYTPPRSAQTEED